MGSSNHYNSSRSNYIKTYFTFQELLEKGITQMKICQKSSGFPEIRKIKIIYQGCIVDCDPKLELSPNCTLRNSIRCRSDSLNSSVGSVRYVSMAYAGGGGRTMDDEIPITTSAPIAADLVIDPSRARREDGETEGESTTTTTSSSSMSTPPMKREVKGEEEEEEVTGRGGRRWGDGGANAPAPATTTIASSTRRQWEEDIIVRNYVSQVSL